MNKEVIVIKSRKGVPTVIEVDGYIYVLNPNYRKGGKRYADR